MPGTSIPASTARSCSQARSSPAIMGWGAPGAAEKMGRIPSPAASPATAARAAAPRSSPACISSACRDVRTKPQPSGSPSGCETLPNRGAITSTGTSRSTTKASVPLGRVTSVRPLWGIEGGRVTLEGDGFPIDPVAPHLRVGAQAARLASASSTALAVLIPEGLDGGSTSVRIDELPGETAFVDIGAPFVTGVHHVDSPAYDRHGNLYVTFSGSRGQQAPVSIFVVRQDGTREPFVSDVPNPTSLAFYREGRLYVSSRFDGTVYRVEADGPSALYATDLGVACGLAFGPDRALFVGDRSGTIMP